LISKRVEEIEEDKQMDVMDMLEDA